MTGHEEEKKTAPLTEKGESLLVAAPAIKEDLTGVIVEKQTPLELWKPKTSLGHHVKSGQIANIDVVFERGLPVFEPEIIDYFFPQLDVEIFNIGQSKGKFGGGRRNVWRQTQKKTAEGNKPSFAALVAVGNRDGYLGIGYGKARETVPAREKALRNAKLNLLRISRGCGSWECGCRTGHSIPMKSVGRCGSVTVTLLPAPRGTGIVAEKEMRKLIGLTGITDIYAGAEGQTRTKLNLLHSCLDALVKLTQVSLDNATKQRLGLVEGKIKKATIVEAVASS